MYLRFGNQNTILLLISVEGLSPPKMMVLMSEKPQEAHSLASNRWLCRIVVGVLLLQLFVNLSFLQQTGRRDSANEEDSTRATKGSKETVISHEVGYVRPNNIFGHVHMAKTAGTELNGLLASRYERVCGHKGYSFDYYQHNERIKAQNKTWTPTTILGDSVSEKKGNFNRGRVPASLMKQRGYEDCDYVSHEVGYRFWKSFGTSDIPMELHVPCRDPIDHLLSMCNHNHIQFSCEGDKQQLSDQIESCSLHVDYRFDASLLKKPYLSAKCFPAFPVERYVDYMGEKLQRRRLPVDYVHRDTNKPRDRAVECLRVNETAAAEVRDMMINNYHYFAFCNECMGSSNALYD